MDWSPLVVIVGLAICIGGYVLFWETMKHSRRYSPNEGGSRALLSTLMIGCGGMLALFGVIGTDSLP